MNGSTNRELAKAMIKDRQEEARRAADQARVVEETRAAARDNQDGGARQGTVIARRVRALPRSPAAQRNLPPRHAPARRRTPPSTASLSTTCTR
jgi:hypothetical protein